MSVGDDGPVLTLVHGFTQTARCWGPLAHDLARDHRLVLLDAPGHGRSSAPPVDWADACRRLADQLGSPVGPGVLVGYSMGARLALGTTLAHPGSVGALVMIGGSPGLASADERAARVRADERRADELRHRPLGEFLDDWMAQPLFAGIPAERRFRSERLANDPDALAATLLATGLGVQPSLWEALGKLATPVLALTGAADAKFDGIARAMSAAGPTVRHVSVPRAGHAAHLEQPAAVADAIRTWLVELPEVFAAGGG